MAATLKRGQLAHRPRNLGKPRLALDTPRTGEARGGGGQPGHNDGFSAVLRRREPL